MRWQVPGAARDHHIALRRSSAQRTMGVHHLLYAEDCYRAVLRQGWALVPDPSVRVSFTRGVGAI